jgi:hypothetical protein
MVGRYAATATAAIAGTVLAGAATVALAAHPVVSRGRAHAVATAINLRHSDLPSLAQQPAEKESAADKRRDAALARCIGETPPAEALADVSSPGFAAKDDSIILSSEADILPSAAAVAKDVAGLRRPRALTCLTSSLRPIIAGSLLKGQKLTSLSIARLPVAVAGADSVTGFRLTGSARVTDGGRTVDVPLYADSIDVTYGQAEVAVDVFQVPLKPPAALDSRLATLIVNRARSAIG